MSLTLTPELEQSIADKVATGLYETTADVIREALRALEEKEEEQWKIAELRREIDKGLADVQAGRLSTKTAAELLDEIRQRKVARKA